MKFVVSSTELLSHLQAVSRVINQKNTLPILDNFLFVINEDNDLKITASDLETTLITNISLENVTDIGSIAIPARILTETLKEFSEQPLNFDINLETLAVVISTETGKFTIVGQQGDDFPQLPELKAEKSTIRLNSEVVLMGLNSTIFATADDELRPVMNGVFIELSTDDIKFVASDAHKLVRYQRTDVTSDTNASFILPKKPATLLKNILPKETNDVSLEFDDKNAVFTLTNYKMVCRLVEGTYPNYETVIPLEQNNILTIDRAGFLTTLKRVSIFSNQASNLIKIKLTGNQITISAQDLDFSISAIETLTCQYDGDEMEIGFNSVFLGEILSNLSSSDVYLKLSDPTKAGILVPVNNEDTDEIILMLLMPMMVDS